jgi:hypothetical protein
MSFLPEDDQEFLLEKAIKHELLTERAPDGKDRNGVLFPAFVFTGDLVAGQNGSLASCTTCDLLVLIPSGYATTKLDSFYTAPRLKRRDGTDPLNANVDQVLFQKTWQFWSRHLDDTDWRVGKDGLRTFLSYIRNELRSA